MASKIQIKRSTGTSAAAGLAPGELAYTEGLETLYIGSPTDTDANGVSDSMLVIGGKAYTDMVIPETASNAASIILKEDTDNGTHGITIKAPDAITADVTLTLPGDDGTANQLLTTNGSGVLTWDDTLSVNTIAASGDVIISGNLEVTGETTTLETADVVVKDKTMVLGVAGGMEEQFYTQSGTTVTVASTAHGFSATQFVYISGAANQTNIPDGVYEVQTIATDTFTITAGGSETVSSTTIFHSSDDVTNATGNGSGIVVPNATATMASILYDGTNGDWNVSENVDIASGKVLKIAGTQVLSAAEYTGNAATVTTNANLTGDITSVGNATAIAAGAIVNADVHASAAIDYSKLGGTVPTWNQNTTGNATTATTATTATNVTITDNENTNENNKIIFGAGAAGDGNIGLEADGDLTYNPSTGTLSATIFSGSVATSTVATTVTITDNENTNEENAILFSADADTAGGNLGVEQDHSGMTYNPSNGKITATGFVGALTGNADSVTTNANLTGDITSVGNATAIASDVIVNADIKSDAGIAYSKMGTIPTWNQNTTGTAAGLSTTLATTSGGTGLAAYTTGDVIYSDTSNSLAKLAKGTEGQVLQMGGSDIPAWGDIDGGSY